MCQYANLARHSGCSWKLSYFLLYMLPMLFKYFFRLLFALYLYKHWTKMVPKWRIILNNILILDILFSFQGSSVLTRIVLINGSRLLLITSDSVTTNRNLEKGSRLLLITSDSVTINRNLENGFHRLMTTTITKTPRQRCPQAHRLGTWAATPVLWTSGANLEYDL